MTTLFPYASTKIQLRPYQVEAIEGIKNYRGRALATGTSGRLLVVMAMGLGKTVVFAHLIPLAKKRVLILCHRDELIRNTVDEVRAAAPDVAIGVDKADERPNTTDQVVVASVQTIWRPDRLKLYRREDFSLVIADEGHHLPARTWLIVLGHFGIVPDVTDLEDRVLQALDNPEQAAKLANKEVLARFLRFRPEVTSPFFCTFTATPNRTDGRGLSCAVDEILEWPDEKEHDILWGVEDGWLVEPAGREIKTKVDISNVHTRMGPDGRDFAPGELSDAVNTVARNNLIIDTHLANCPGEQGVVFLTGIKHVEDFTKLANERGIVTIGVTSQTDKRLRVPIINDFKGARIQLLANHSVFTEGVNLSGIAAVHMARPTQSSLVFTQAIGRGARVVVDLSPYATADERRAAIAASRKPIFWVFDYADTSKVGVQNMHTLYGLDPNINIGKGLLKAVKAVKEAGDVPPGLIDRPIEPEELRAMIRVFDPLRKATPEAEISRISNLAWVKVYNGYYLRLLDKGSVYVLVTPESCMVLVEMKNKQTFALSTGHRNILDAIGSADRYLRRTFADIWFFQTDAPWRSHPMSDPQKKFLDGVKIPYPPNCTKGQAQTLLDQTLYRDQGIKQTAPCPKCGQRAVVDGQCLNCQLTAASITRQEWAVAFRRGQVDRHGRPVRR